ncbi:hypothetical protein BE21_49800 [Sorangium cellulosum]|uniref:Uncharacterized protein n=1 Tax=Sorangium cellulosum TaxID=56 RepID=A0A150TH13_SORCE|nr:hypothetical protein BE21_49800 [Sorangium cellulosum]
MAPDLGRAVPADLAFALAPLVGLANVAGALARRRVLQALLVANVLSGLTIGLFAAFQLQSFVAWVGGTALAAGPSVAALFAHWRRR